MKQLIDRIVLHIVRWLENRLCIAQRRRVKNDIFFTLCREKMPYFIKAMCNEHGELGLIVSVIEGNRPVWVSVVHMHSTDCPVYVERKMCMDGGDALDACLDAAKYDDICYKVPTHLKPMMGLAYATFIKQGTTFEELVVEYDLKHIK